MRAWATAAEVLPARWVFAVALAILAIAGTQNRRANAATPDIFTTIVQPVGVAATQDAVFVSTPFCVNDSQTGKVTPSIWQIVKIASDGTQTAFATLPDNPDYGVKGTPNILSDCQETHLAVTTGAAGFKPGHLLATQGGSIYEFDDSGTLARTIVIPSLEVPVAHTSLVFDTTGTFGNNLLVVGTDSASDGEIWTLDVSGNATLLFTLKGTDGGAACQGPAGVPCLESPDIAPLSGPIGSAFPGSLFAPLPGFDGIQADIGALSPTLTFSAPGTVKSPEAVHVIPSASSACTFQFQPAGAPSPVSYEFFNASFGFPSVTSSQVAAGSLGSTIYAYKASDFVGLEGQLLVTTKGGSPGISASTDSSIAFGAFDSTTYNSEGSAFVQCLATASPTPTPTLAVLTPPGLLDGVVTPTPTDTPTPTPTPTSTVMATPSPVPPDRVRVPALVNVTGSPGQTVIAGTFVVRNDSDLGQNFSVVTVAFSRPSLFSSATLIVTAAGQSPQQVTVTPVTNPTDFNFSELFLSPKSSLTFTLHVTLAGTKTAAAISSPPIVMAGVITPRNGATGGAGLPIGLVMLGLVVMPIAGPRRRRLLLAAGGLVLIAVTQVGCDPCRSCAATTGSTQTVTQIQASLPGRTVGRSLVVSGGVAFVGLPATLGTVNIPS